MAIENYIILSGDTADELRLKVRQQLIQNQTPNAQWEPQGGVVALFDRELGETFYQAMIYVVEPVEDETLIDDDIPF